jgi:hypothetical protein
VAAALDLIGLLDLEPPRREGDKIFQAMLGCNLLPVCSFGGIHVVDTGHCVRPSHPCCASTWWRKDEMDDE